MEALSDRLSMLGYDKDLRTRNKPSLSRYAVYFGTPPSPYFRIFKWGREGRSFEQWWRCMIS